MIQNLNKLKLEVPYKYSLVEIKDSTTVVKSNDLPCNSTSMEI